MVRLSSEARLVPAETHRARGLGASGHRGRPRRAGATQACRNRVTKRSSASATTT